MDLYRLLSRVQFRCDLLVQKTDNDEAQHLEFSRRQLINQTARLASFRACAQGFPASIQSVLNRFDELVVVKRFQQKIDRAIFHGLTASGNITVAGDEHDLLASTALLERFLEPKPV